MIATLAAYRRLTHDLENYDGDVLNALASAQRFVEDQCDRQFELNDRTESLKIHRNGRVYPHATPVLSVSAPSTALLDNSSVWAGSPGFDVTINYSGYSGYSDWGTYAGAGGYDPGFAYTGMQPPVLRLTVTYQGGFTQDNMPETLIRLVSDVAKAQLQDMPQIPPGANRVTSGDITLEGRLNAQYPEQVWQGIRLWKRREI